MLALVLGVRAQRASGVERARLWMYAGTASCGMWAEIILILAMLYLRRLN